MNAAAIKKAYADLNGEEAANEIDLRLYEAAARYMDVNDYGIDVEAERIALGALDVLRLVDSGEFVQFGIGF